MAGKSILSRRSTLANVCGHTMIVVKLRTAVGLSQVSCHINHAQAGCRVRTASTASALFVWQLPVA